MIPEAPLSFNTNARFRDRNCGHSNQAGESGDSPGWLCSEDNSCPQKKRLCCNFGWSRHSLRRCRDDICDDGHLTQGQPVRNTVWVFFSCGHRSWRVSFRDEEGLSICGLIPAHWLFSSFLFILLQSLLTLSTFSPVCLLWPQGQVINKRGMVCAG